MIAQLLTTLILSTTPAKVIDVASLLPEMTDLSRLAEFPNPVFIERQASSYDRASKTPGTPEWMANADYGKYIRTENNGQEERVMADLTGPGAVVRIWSANPVGEAHFYFDGEKTASLNMSLSDLLTGKWKPFLEPYARVVSHGCNLHFPIPYAKSLKITVSGPPDRLNGMYYHVNYRTYAVGTPVQTFRLPQAMAALSRIVPRGQSHAVKVVVQPGATEKLFSANRGAAIDDFRLTAKAADLTAALRASLLVGAFDGKETIRTPLGDFFGSAPGLNPYETFPTGMAKNGEMRSSWRMPFGKSATLSVTNTGTQPVELSGTVTTTSYRWGAGSLYFHAKWHTEALHSRPMRDWNYVSCTGGKGVFVGTSLNIVNPTPGWWGEGDEKIYVDGETFPSTFGTGTEDYYGYAWSSPDLFQHPYHSQSRCDGPGTRGYSSINRWQILDKMPFTKSFRFDMEIWHWEEVDEHYAVTVYYYGDKNVKDNIRAPRAAELVVPAIPAPPRVAGGLEGEELKIAAKTGGEIEAQGFGNLSNWKQLWWRDGKPGDTITFVIPVEKAGRYDLTGNFCAAGDYGVMGFDVNGVAGADIDFYNKELVWKKMSLGQYEFRAGDNLLKVTVRGANDQAVKRYMLGIDYLRLEPK